ncbi:MAG: histidine kinase [Geminicoccaceae bacterium]
MRASKDLLAELGPATPLARRSRTRRLRGALGHLSLRLRLIALVLAVELVVLAGAGYQMLSNARGAVQEEIAASLSLARHFAIAAVGSLLRDNEPSLAVQYLPTLLQQPRHVRLHVLDASRGNRLPIPPIAPLDREADAPAWFERLIGVEPESQMIPIEVAGHHYGTIVITTEPRDEISEVWTDLSELLRLWVTACLGLTVLLYAAIGYWLRPLATVNGALRALQAGNYRVRVPPIATPDLAAIGHGCNSLAAGLEQALAEKDRLNQRLIRLQDTERKNIALELHDEFGPCLFGIKAEADSLAREAARIAGGDELVERAESILGIVSMMQISNRALLNRLRPMAIGQFPLAQVLADMLRGFAARSREVGWSIAIDPALGDADETVEITIYRVVQEAVTNALRHAQPRRIEVSVRRLERAGLGSWFRVRVADDGRGLAPGWSEGMGLHGMGERVGSLGGRLQIRVRPGGGTMLAARIPELRPPSSGGAESDAA